MALDLFELTAMSTGIGQDLVRDWRALQTRIERARASGEIPSPSRLPREGGAGAAHGSRSHRNRGDEGPLAVILRSVSDEPTTEGGPRH